MLEIHQRLGMHCHEEVHDRIMLSHEQRDKGRIRTLSTAGEEVRIFLERGRPLAVGEYLLTTCGRHVLVEGAVETVASASCDDWLSFSRACYHLGNRHVKVQLGACWLRLLPDHVLEDLLRLQGLEIRHEQAVFIPEPGAYSHGLLVHAHQH
ncbi:MAG: urease accessory protein UreE [Pseudomonadales bacterium]|nr:urease accessory protein UreE [Pseudomonadales bacterium]